jgi:SAM-dependent methyltransferase
VQDSVYAADARLQEDHWWYVGRRALFGRELRALELPRSAPVLEVGTSAGTNLRLLRDLGFDHVTGLDFSDEAIRLCAEKGLGRVEKGDITAMPFADASFALVIATDIVEHVEDDARALSEIARVLEPGAAALLTVPAFPSLWGLQDVVSNHKRRYRMDTFLSRVAAAGLTVERSFHFNYLLFGPIWAARQLMKLWRHDFRSESEVNTPLVNRLLGAIFRLDVTTAPRLAPPFGVSILALARKPVSAAAPTAPSTASRPDLHG